MLRIQRLLAAKSAVKEALHRHKDELAVMRECTLPPLELILTLANNITSTHAAPAGWVEGTPLIKSHPPAPQLVDMREGFLAKYNAEYVKSHGGGEDAVVSTTVSRLSEQDAVGSTKRKVEMLEQFIQQRKDKLYKANRSGDGDEEMNVATEATATVAGDAVDSTLTMSGAAAEDTSKARKVNITFDMAYDSDEDED